jgi:hypothetical protein
MQKLLKICSLPKKIMSGKKPKLDTKLDDVLRQIEVGYISHHESMQFRDLSQKYIGVLSGQRSFLGYDIKESSIFKKGLDVKLWVVNGEDEDYEKGHVENDFRTNLQACMKSAELSQSNFMVKYMKTNSKDHDKVRVTLTDTSDIMLKAFLFAYAETVLKKEVKPARPVYIKF